jgi:hypothetical protein
VTVLLIYAHATSVFTVAALDVATLTYLWLRRSGWVPVLWLLAVNVVIGVLVIPVLWAIVQQTGRSDLAWIEKPAWPTPGILGIRVDGGENVYSPIARTRRRIITHHTTRGGGGVSSGVLRGRWRQFDPRGAGSRGRAGGGSGVPGKGGGVSGECF